MPWTHNRMGGLWGSTILTDGTAQIIVMSNAPLPCTVFANPAAGDTITISYSCDGGTTYTNWAAGAVAVYTESVFDAPITHIRGQRTAGAGVTSVFGVC